MLNFGRRYAASRILKSLIMNKVLVPEFSQRAAANHPQMVVFSSDLIGQGINMYGYWEFEELEVLAQWLKANGHVGGAMLDVGANIGNHSIFMSRYFEAVHAIEPNPRSYEVLALNANLAENIHCHQVAASDTNGTLRFEQEAGNIGGTYVLPEGWQPTGKAMELPCRRLDEEVADVRDVRLVKIDVEGHEYAAIQGMKGILDRDSPILVFEQHFGEFVDGKSKVVELLRSYGYTEFHSIDRIPSTHNAGKLGKLWFFACSLVRGMRIEVRPLDEVPPGFYEMLIARKPLLAEKT
ncbi:methyltransferase, FkbM family [Variovorax sp. CF079]|nr:methyltransferase, FkbM family [Variovorax sp. CF079]